MHIASDVMIYTTYVVMAVLRTTEGTAKPCKNEELGMVEKYLA